MRSWQLAPHRVKRPCGKHNTIEEEGVRSPHFRLSFSRVSQLSAWSPLIQEAQKKEKKGKKEKEKENLAKRPHLEVCDLILNETVQFLRVQLASLHAVANLLLTPGVILQAISEAHKRLSLVEKKNKIK